MRARVGLAAGSLVAAMIGSPGVAAAAELALTPPLGWNSWNAYRCDIDETKIKAAADAMVAQGLKAAGYTYVNIDDCWQAHTRDANGNLTAHPDRFPNGIKPIADYVHAKGLKLGIYATPGTKTCANIWDAYPGALGSLGHEQADAATFAAWGVDYLKYDWCQADRDGLVARDAFTKMRDALAATGRPIVLSIHDEPQLPVPSWRPEVANLWRTTSDIAPTWSSVSSIIDKQVGLESFSGPGAWNDPDMLQVGNGTLTAEENRTHFSMWALLNAPLLTGNVLGSMSPATRAVLTNPDVIAVDQDWGGHQGVRVRDTGDQELWRKPMSDGSQVVVLLNRGAAAATMSANAADLGFPGRADLTAKELWDKTTTAVGTSLSVSVPSHGVKVYRVSSAAGTVTPVVSGSTNTVKSVLSGKVVDNPASSTTPGTQLVQWSPNGGANQKWVLTRNANGTYAVKNSASGQCMDVELASTDNGAKVLQFGCHGGENQQWSLRSVGSGYELVAWHSGKCLDVPNAATANGTGLVQWTCSGSANQQWTFQAG
ncbi:alpha-galactosidase [Actinokineospora soli]|uniref:Alpha-galactosidase n=1 Tax=Actinokineospora soli TaxID=1048753 RepID=A0ABW2TMT7_9PSEU